MDPSNPPPPSASPPDTPAPVKNLEIKAALLLLLMLALVLGSALYVLYARGAFESTQRLVLIADDSEGAVVRVAHAFHGFGRRLRGRIALV